MVAGVRPDRGSQKPGSSRQAAMENGTEHTAIYLSIYLSISIATTTYLHGDTNDKAERLTKSPAYRIPSAENGAISHDPANPH